MTKNITHLRDKKAHDLYFEYVSAQFYIVVIEWGGRRPPTRYYKRVRAITKRLHGYQSTDRNLWVSGASLGPKAITLQEGVIMCPDKRTALLIASWARDGGAVYVEIMKASHYDISATSDEELDKVNEFTEAITKRGKPPAPDFWAITCIHEMKPRQVHESRAIVCPECGSAMVRVEHGQQHIFKKPKNAETDPKKLFSYWERTRFERGKYFIPIELMHESVAGPQDKLTPISRLPRTLKKITETEDKKVYDLMTRQDNVDRIYVALDKMGKHFSVDEKMGYLDAMFTGERFYKDEKEHNRIMAIAMVGKKGAEIGSGTLLSPSDKLDMYDVWPRWDAAGMVSLALLMHGRAD